MRAGVTGAIRQKKMLLINSVRAPSVMVILGFTLMAWKQQLNSIENQQTSNCSHLPGFSSVRRYK